MCIGDRCGVTAAALYAAAVLGLSCAIARAQITVTVDASRRYQTILGWGKCTPEQLGVPRELRDLVVQRAVDDLGLNRLRLEPPGGAKSTHRAWEWLNDDADPYHINWPAFSTKYFDRVVAEWVVPFKQRVEARGERFNLYVSPSFFDHGSSGTAPPWLLYSPEEYAEYAMALLLRLRDKFGIEADYYCICNEAGHDNLFKPGPVLDAIVALGRRMRAAGLKTRIEFPESVNPKMAMWYLREAQKRPEVWNYIGVISYHLYGPTQDIPKLWQIARAHGLPTAQTEYMWLTMDHLYRDLTAGGVSYWEIYGLAGVDNPSVGAYVNSRSFRGGPHYWSFRQVLHYVRPGAVRVQARCSSGPLKALAFDHAGRITAILINTHKGAGPVRARLEGLPPGEYALSRSVADRPYEELGVVRAAGPLSIDVPANAVVTIYPHQGNQPPTVTDWYTEPNFLTLPRATCSLVCRAVDPERDALTYRWRLVSAPAGAAVKIADPFRPRTEAAGLSAPGRYCFEVTVSDGHNAVAKRLWLRVFPGNQPPVLFDVHNRIPVRVRLPVASTQLRGAAIDRDGDKLAYRWSIVRQPRGASARLESPGQQKCRVTGMQVPGDYVFRLTATDGHHTVHQDHTVTVFPLNTPPQILRAEAEPPTVSSPQGRCRLSVVVADPDGDPVTVHWSLLSAPAGAKAHLLRPGARSTEVTGLTVPGRYVFEVRAIDNADCTRRRLVVRVQP